MAAFGCSRKASTAARRTPGRRGGLSTFLAFVAAVAILTRIAASAFVVAPAGVATRACGRAAPIGRGAPKVSLAAKTREECEAEENNPLNKIKSLGLAGTISYALWESAFWIIGGGGAFAAYVWSNGHLPDFSNQEEMAKVGGGAFVFINGARLIVPVRIGLAISTAPWIEENIVKKWFPQDEECAVYDDDVEAGAKEGAKAPKEKVGA
uniref:Uncharacterized protein n=1 Tax=Pyrodinium bahamense TaxID=73915 RepID=A0A7S0ALT8_9DINO|mmetsp:Transcript_37426/g.104018  ORF Transcript_37426/g.104018 Transcript_37426/m.104018 type:complete len:209 (+) Transcript_37426:110-736(+)